jgi:hypothetical protein
MIATGSTGRRRWYVNNQLAIQQLREFISYVNDAQSVVQQVPEFELGSSVAYQSALLEMRRRLPVVEAIAKAVGDEDSAGRVKNGIDGGWGLDVVEGACQLLIGRVEKQALIDDIVRPSGPQLAAAQLHPWVWNAAVDLWDHGHFSEAVRAASSAIFDRHLPAKVGYESPQGAADLITKAFSLNPPSTSEARLRFTDLAEGTQDWKSAHEGAMNFGKGCAKGIRNVTTHGATPSEQQALEALASLSLLARWIDEAGVVTP